MEVLRHWRWDWYSGSPETMQVLQEWMCLDRGGPPTVEVCDSGIPVIVEVLRQCKAGNNGDAVPGEVLQKSSR